MPQRDLKEVGLMVTTPRLRVLEILEGEENQHMTADYIHQKLVKEKEGVSLGTVYRILTQFENAGLVVRRQFEKGPACYELDRGDHHSHMVCVHCGKIIEFSDPLIEERLQQLSEKQECTLTEHSLVLYVACSDCADKS